MLLYFCVPFLVQLPDTMKNMEEQEGTHDEKDEHEGKEISTVSIITALRKRRKEII